MSRVEISQGRLVSDSGALLLQGINLSIQQGELHVLLGPNGAGKSTLLKLLSGDLSPSSGSVSINGKSVNDISTQHLSHLRSVLPQLGNIAFPITAREVIAMGRYPYHHSTKEENDELINQAVREVDVSHLLERLYPSLSGGEQQRVQLARVLAQQTALIFLDEPLSALDIAHQITVMETLRRKVRAGKTVVMVLHDINLALRYATHITLLKQGRVYATGHPQGVISPENLAHLFGINAHIAHQPELGVDQIAVLGAA